MRKKLRTTARKPAFFLFPTKPKIESVSSRKCANPQTGTTLPSRCGGTVLIPDELHNWLLLRDLKCPTALSSADRTVCPRGPCEPWVLASTRFSTAEDAQNTPRKSNCLQCLPTGFYGLPCRGKLYSSSGVPSSTSVSKRVQLLRKAIRTLPIGPLRCLAIMISALPCSSGSSCL